MPITNYIFIIIGLFVTLIGIISIFFPGLTKIINAPGGYRLKSFIAIIIGLIILIIGITIELPK